MNSTPSPDQTDPRNVAIAALKEAREQIGPGDDQLVGLKEQVSKLVRTRCGGRSFRPAEARCCPAPPVIAWQTGFTVARRRGSGSQPLCCCLCLAVVWRRGQAGYCPVGTRASVASKTGASGGAAAA